MLISSRSAAWCIGLLLLQPLAAADTLYEIPIVNPGFEDHLNGWEKRTLGGAASFEIDRQDSHTGKASVKMNAGEMSRHGIVSEPFSVAQGEVIHAGVWV